MGLRPKRNKGGARFRVAERRAQEVLNKPHASVCMHIHIYTHIYILVLMKMKIDRNRHFEGSKSISELNIK